MSNDTLYACLPPVWVEDPASGQSVNVAPFLKALHEFEPGQENPLNAGAVEAVLGVIRQLCLMPHDPAEISPIELSNLYRDLFRLYDLFAQTQTGPGLASTAQT